jgi:hypothetical protein
MTTPAGEVGAGSGVRGSGGQYSMSDVAWIAKQHWNVPAEISGGKNAPVVIAIAVAWAESSGNTQAHNSTPPDDSYGLWQVNMYGSLGPARRRAFGLSDNKDLFSASTNARVAFTIFQQAGNSFRPWSTYGSGAYKQYLDQAYAAYKNPTQPGNVQQGKVNTTIPFLDDFKEWVSGGVLRIAMFIGGAALLIGAVVLVAKKGVKQ